MNDSDQDLANLFWMKLPEWADDAPDNSVLYMPEEFATRYNIPLKHYDPSDSSMKEKGCKVVLVKKSKLEKKKCESCREEYDTSCPYYPEYKLLIKETKSEGVYCCYCDKEDDHNSWHCPEKVEEKDVVKDTVCETCGVKEYHCPGCCLKTRRNMVEPGRRMCGFCHKYDDSQHWSEDCPKIIGSNKVCWICESVGDHHTDDCDKFCVSTTLFCMCCEATDDHDTEDCPREDRDGRKYCESCDHLGDHSTQQCPTVDPLNNYY